MASPIKRNVVVADAELVATVIQPAQPSSQVVVTVQPSNSQRVPVSNPDHAAGTGRFKIIQGL